MKVPGLVDAENKTLQHNDHMAAADFAEESAAVVVAAAEQPAAVAGAEAVACAVVPGLLVVEFEQPGLEQGLPDGLADFVIARKGSLLLKLLLVVLAETKALLRVNQLGPVVANMTEPSEDQAQKHFAELRPAWKVSLKAESSC